MRNHAVEFNGGRTLPLVLRTTQLADNKLNISGARRELVLHLTRNACATGYAGELSAVISRRTGISEAAVDRIIAGELIAVTAELSTLRSAILGGMEAARMARADVLAEI